VAVLVSNEQIFDESIEAPVEQQLVRLWLNSFENLTPLLDKDAQ
jgi:hypothetical protein